MSPKAPCKESAQTHVPTHGEPPLAETHMKSGHSEDFTSPIDASQVPSEKQPSFFSPLSPSSFPTHSFVSSPQPREGDSPNPSGFDHPSPIMDEPPSSGPQEPISQSEMDTTPSNSEKGQGTTLIESKTASTLFNLQGASYLREDVVTTQVVVKDTVNVAVTGDPAVKDSFEVAVKPNLTVQVTVAPTVNISTDNTIHGKAPVISPQPDIDAVIVEDVSDDDVPLSQFLKSEIEGAPHIQALGLESSFVRSDEITQKHNESVRTPTASKPQSFPSPPRRLRSGGSSTSFRLEALETRCLSMESKLDSLSTMVASGFSTIQEAIQVLSATLDAANLPKGEKRARSESQRAESGRERSGTEGVPKQDVAQGEPVTKKASRSEGESAAKGRSVYAKKKRGTRGDSGSKKEQVQEADNLFEYEIAGETVLMSKEALEAMQGNVPSKNPILPPVTIREPTPIPKESALERQ
ncbi:hypothetical protein POM88_039543 [Heracleum sosnowskyi]|uniref:Uncharacterized protein n=1 Tax=Heracleum sosnowskyi TaxID=360622 RepID=A0AAD8HA88_9APIA|nr:hypothetical protein POM88_039543 [Heracleum sosnowskyi]